MIIENLTARGMNVVDRLPTTVAPVDGVRELIDLPSSLKGKLVLDIGAGVTDRPTYFNNHGARLVSVDINYSNPDKMFNEAALFVKSALGSEGDLYKKAAGNFFIDYLKINRSGVYVTGDAMNLPFKDNTFDFAYSTHCLVSFMHDPEMFGMAIQEALRVIKKGGKLQVSPFFEQRIVDMVLAMRMPALPGSINDAQDFLKKIGVKFSTRPTKKSGTYFIEFIKK